MKSLPAVFLLLISSLSNVFGQRTAHASLRVTVQIEGSISIEFSSSASEAPITASGSGAVSFLVPTFGGSFSPQSNTVAAGDTTLLISSPFAVRVLKANLLSSTYTLKAKLSSRDISRSWLVDGMDISGGAEKMITSGEFYGTVNPHTLVVSGPADGLRQQLPNAIRFLVIAN
jgi:hypothetical protein